MDEMESSDFLSHKASLQEEISAHSKTNQSRLYPIGFKVSLLFDVCHAIFSVSTSTALTSCVICVPQKKKSKEECY